MSNQELFDQAVMGAQDALLSNPVVIEHVVELTRQECGLTREVYEFLDEHYTVLPEHLQDKYDHYWDVYSHILIRVGIEAVQHLTRHISGVQHT